MEPTQFDHYSTASKLGQEEIVFYMPNKEQYIGDFDGKGKAEKDPALRTVDSQNISRLE